jgi:3-oxoadipate enol-lactonase
MRRSFLSKGDLNMTLHHSGYADLNGAHLYYEMAGEGHPLVLIHGGDFNCRMWDDQFSLFAQSYRVIRYDARGYGKTTTAEVDFSHIDDLYGLLNFLNVDKACLLGQSWAGGLVIDFTLQHSDRVNAVIVIAPSLGGYEFTSEPYQRYAIQIGDAFKQEDTDRIVKIYTQTWIAGSGRSLDEVNPTVVEQIREMFIQALAMPEPPESQPLDPPAVGRLGEITVPTGIIVGDQDLPDFFAIAEFMEKHIPHAKKVIIPGAAHMVNMEEPEIFNQTVLDFLKNM